ncbi:hypothetical protein, partial [Sodalis-like endosymbiont of Proechinophthirus fluctus]|uniref:hypothetical protein n=1 Tax=Sodalis-like endosymbiont of Proechinophthirus fluctus TaxID=1462730 RepID=UPI00195C0097
RLALLSLACLPCLRKTSVVHSVPSAQTEGGEGARLLPTLSPAMAWRPMRCIMVMERGAVPNSSIREQGNEQVQLLKVRKETRRRSRLSAVLMRDTKRCFAARRCC